MPGPRGLPVLGSLLDFNRSPLDFLARQAHMYGPISKFRLPFGEEIVLVNEPKAISDILINKEASYQKSKFYDVLRIAMGSGLITSDGPYHRKQRRIVAAAFAQRYASDWAESTRAATSHVTNEWKNGDTIEVTTAMSRIVLGSTARIIFGPTQAKVVNELLNATIELSRLAGGLLARTFPRQFARLPLKGTRTLQDCRTTINSCIDRLLEAQQVDRASRPPMFYILADMMKIEARSSTEIKVAFRDEIVTLILAAYETTSNTLSWLWYHILNHDYRIAACTGDPDRSHDPQDCEAVRVLEPAVIDAMIRETLRLYPQGWVLGRRTVAPVTLGQYSVPVKTQILISPYVVYRDQSNYDSGNDFDVSRWLSGKLIPSGHRYIPFGGGHRLCLGQDLAHQQIRMVTEIVQSRFHIQKCGYERLHPVATSSLPPSDKFYFRVSTRHV